MGVRSKPMDEAAHEIKITPWGAVGKLCFAHGQHEGWIPACRRKDGADSARGGMGVRSKPMDELRQRTAPGASR